jgi:hypothetical protein
MKKIATYKTGAIVEVITVSGGWTTIVINGEQKKVRNSDLSATRVEEPKEVATPKASRAPKAPKEKKPIDINTRKNGVVDTLYLPQYHSAKVPMPDGTVKRALDCGDEVAAKLRVMTLDQVFEFAAQVCKTTDKSLRAKYEGLNAGLARMSLGNIVRKAMRDGA